jgi:hypothetical protein
MTPHEFIAKWKPVDLSERSACQQHFLDLCELFNQPKPAAADPEGEWYTFEKGVHKTEGVGARPAMKVRLLPLAGDKDPAGDAKSICWW